MKMPSVAIVGSGPSGCYLAQALRKEWPESEICIFDQLPVPFGLIRYGVAPDHPGTKAIARQFDRLFTREKVKFFGNVAIGSDISLGELRSTFNIVVLAVGLQEDRDLNIPGEDLLGIYGSGSITRLFNDHPGEVNSQYHLGKRCIIIGNGNVAIDVLRLLSKSDEEFLGSEVSDYSLDRIDKKNIEEINIIGRSSLLDAKFDDLMLKELQQLNNVKFNLYGGFTEEEKQTHRYAILESLQSTTSALKNTIQINFYFGIKPLKFIGNGSVEYVEFESLDSTRIIIKTDSVIKAIGFKTSEKDLIKKESLMGIDLDLEKGRLDHGLYCVGWFKRGPVGTIPANRADSKAVAEIILSDVGNFSETKSGSSLILAKIKHHTDYSGWKKIDYLETSNANRKRSRKKINCVNEMIKIALCSNNGDSL